MDYILKKFTTILTPARRFDAKLTIGASLVIFSGAILFDPMEKAFTWSRNLEHWQIDEIIVSLSLISITLVFLLSRRLYKFKKIINNLGQRVDSLKNLNEELERRESMHMAILQNTNDQSQTEIAACQLATQTHHESESRFRALVEHSPAGMFIFQDGCYCYVNPQFAEMFGYSVKEIMTTHPSGVDLIDEDDLGRVRTHVRKLIRGEAASLRYTFRGKRKGGAVVDINILSAMTDFEGRRAITGILLNMTEREQTEAPLGLNSQWFQTVIDAMPMRIAVRGVDGERLLINQATREMWGYATEQPLPPSNIVPHLNETAKQHLEDTRLQILEQGQPMHYERLRTLANASQEWIKVHWSPLRNEQSKIIGTVSITEDITQRKQAEEALQKSEAQQRILVEQLAILSEIGRIISASPDIDDVYAPFAAAVQRLLPFDRMTISIVDMQMMVITNSYVSGIDVSARRADATLPISGTLTETTINTPQGFLFHPRDRMEVSQQFHQLLPIYDAGLRSFLSIPLRSRNTALGALQLQVRQPNFYTSQHQCLAQSVGRQIAGAVATAQLYRALQAAEQALRESEEQFRGLVENSPAAICLKDHEGRLRLVNQRLVQWYNTSEDTMLGKTSYDIASRKHAERIDAQDRHVLATQTTVEYEVDYTFADGTSHAILVTKYPVINAIGEPIGVGTIHTDITARRRAEARIERHNEELQQAVQETTREMEALMARMVRQEKLAVIGQLAGSIAHELRNPLSVLKQALFLLSRLHQGGRLASTNPKIPDYIQLMDAEIDTAEGVISQLLAFARSTPPSPQWLDLRDLLDDVLRQRPLGEDMRVRMIFAPHSHQLYADPWCMQHVLLNLLRNAAAACEDEGRVTIHARVDEAAHQYRISIRDTGHGIPDDEIQHVFDPLYTRKIRGTGLGLSLCQQLIEQQGGSITVESQEGHGTTIDLRLPMPLNAEP